MTPKGDKLSPIFKSLRPDESHLESAAAAAVQEAEQRWPLFRAFAPSKPLAAPELTQEERLNWSNPATDPKTEAATPQHKQALTLPGLNEQLAQGLSKMTGNKPASRRASVKAKTQKSEVPLLPASEPLIAQTKQPAQEQPKTPKAWGAAKTTVNAPNVSRPAHEEDMPRTPAAAALPTPATLQTSAPMRARQMPASTEVPTGPTLNSAKSVIKAAAVTAKVAEPLVAPPMVEAPVRKSADNTSESLRSLFNRLEAPAKPTPKTTAKKPSFLGRLNKR